MAAHPMSSMTRIPADGVSSGISAQWPAIAVVAATMPTAAPYTCRRARSVRGAAAMSMGKV